MENRVDVGSCDDVSTTDRTSHVVELSTVSQQLETCLNDLQQVAALGRGLLLVVGASSSEIAGFRIGTQTSLEIGSAVVDAVLGFQSRVGCEVAFQCCEHLNRSLVMERDVATKYGFTQVSAIPVPGAGGAVAASAYFKLSNPCLVESVAADAGIDIGDTFIGMHLKRIAVPVRGTTREVGQAHVTMATTRPPLIGGVRAVYDVDEARSRIHMK